MNTLSQICRYIIAIVSMVPMLGISLLIAPFWKDGAWRLLRSWNQFALSVFGIEVEMQYEFDTAYLDQGGVIVSLNQQSILDPTIAYGNWGKRILSIWNIEYALIPFFGWSTLIVGWIIIRQMPRQAKRQIERAAQYVSEGGLVHLSAEGKRSADGNLNPYKKGPVVMAIQAQAPLLPVYMIGTRDRLPPGEWKIRPGKVIIRWLAPIETKGLTYDDRNELLQQLEAAGKREHEKVKEN